MGSTVRRGSRPWVRVLVTAALLGTTVVVRSSLPADADPPPAGPPDVPLAVDTDPRPDVFETTLTAQPVTRAVGDGRTAEFWTFNGTVPGPEIRLRVGDTVIVHYRNELPLPSAVHWHGIELSNASDGTGLTQNAVQPGGSFLYKFMVPRPGVFWYHPHHNPTNQVFRGLYGSIVVTDDADDTLVAEGVLPSRAHTRTLVLSDTTVCKEPGHNDTDTYDDSLPWAGGGPLPEQPGPFPSDLCDRPMDDHGNPVLDANGRPIPLPAGAIPNVQRIGQGRTNEGQTVLANGRTPGGREGTPETPGNVAAGAALLDLPAGQGLRLQAINAATTRYFRLRLTDSTGRQIPLVRVGGEGGLLDAARLEGNRPTRTPLDFDAKFSGGEIVLGPSDRADLVVAVPADTPAGVATLWTLDYSRTGQGYAFLPTVPVMHLNVTAPTGAAYTIAEGTPLRTHPRVDDPVEQLGTPYPLPDPNASPLLVPLLFSPEKPGSPNPEIQLRIGSSIDGVPGNHEAGGGDYRAVPHQSTTRYARLGDLLELTVTNATVAHHAFHLHGFSFQPLALEGLKSERPNYLFDYREFVDTIDIPDGYTLRFRVRLDDRPLMDGTTPGGGMGRWVFHCHIFFHAVLGMHSELVVLAPDGNEKPFVNVDSPLVAVDEGGTATNSGTYADPDGDPVTLVASSGTVTDLGDGRWTWSHSSGGDPVGSRTVHVTATDARGFRNQTAFDLDVGNVAPDVVVTAPPSGSPYRTGSTVTVVASVTDPGSSVPTCRFDWDDGAGAGPPVAVEGGTCSDSRTITRPGGYTVVVSADDGNGGTDADSTMVVVYDPDVGFVTGSGTTASGQAAFDLSVKHLKGVPAGKVLYNHGAAGFDFAATGFRWLLVAEPRAQARGSGTVGGLPGYEFLVTVVDGRGTGGPDRLGLKVWEATGGRVVYDNAPGSPDDIDAVTAPPITLGSLVIHDT